MLKIRVLGDPAMGIAISIHGMLQFLFEMWDVLACSATDRKHYCRKAWGLEASLSGPRDYVVLVLQWPKPSIWIPIRVCAKLKVSLSWPWRGFRVCESERRCCPKAMVSAERCGLSGSIWSEVRLMSPCMMRRTDDSAVLIMLWSLM